VARRTVDGEEVEKHTRKLREFYRKYIERLNDERKDFSGF